ncbi:hypothetical protein Tco_0869364, partial [Tanacetum coccineum]
EDKSLLLKTTISRTVPLLPVVPDRAKSELKASRKRKTVVADAGESSHPPKRLREDHGTPSGASVGGKFRSVVQRLLVGVVLNAEVRGGAIPTLPFVTSSVSATPEHEDGDHTDFLWSSGTGRVTNTLDCILNLLVGAIASVLRCLGLGQNGGRWCVRFGDLKDGDVSCSEESESKEKRLTVLSATVVEGGGLQKPSRALPFYDYEGIFVGLQKRFNGLMQRRSRLEKISRYDQLKVINEKFDKLHADFVDMALHLEENYSVRLSRKGYAGDLDYCWDPLMAIERAWVAIMLCHWCYCSGRLWECLGVITRYGIGYFLTTVAVLRDTTTADLSWVHITFSLKECGDCRVRIAPISMDDYEVVGTDD